MKIKAKMTMLALAAFLATGAVGCQSKTEQKADEVTDDYKDVEEAKAEGDSSEIREERQELEESRQDYREMAKDSTKRQA